MKFLDIFPRSLLIKFGYTSFGSKLVKTLRKKNTKTWYELKNGIKLYLDLTNPHTWDLIQDKDPEIKVKQVFLDNINHNDTVLDIGANIGEYSLVAAQKIGKLGRVISIEPLTETAYWLKKNLELNDFNNCEVLEIAIGGTTGQMKLYKKSESARMRRLDSTADGKNLIESTNVKVMTIDSLLKSKKIEKIDMIKMDVEGFEYEVLVSCKESFNQNKIKKIICEIHLDYLKKKGIDKNKIYELLTNNGFSVSIIEDKPVLINKTHIMHILAVNKRK